MNILVIEDNELKFKQIEESLNRILNCPNIVCMKSRNSGLVSLRMRNVKSKLQPYDLVITDNYLPLDNVNDNDMFDRDVDIEPFAKEIVDEIRRLGLENLPIIVCSSGEVEECDYNYKINYDPSISLDENFRLIFCDLAPYKKLQEQRNIESSSLIERALELNNILTDSYWDLDSARRIFVNASISDRIVKDNPSNCDSGSISQASVKKLTKSNKGV